MRTGIVLAMACLLSVGSARAQESTQDTEADSFLASLDWQVGPTTVAIPGGASFEVPAGFAFLDEANTARFQEAMENLSSPGETMFVPETMEWFAIFTFDPIGYVEDDETIDADAVIESIREGQELANQELASRGWTTLTIDGWELEPSYHTDTQWLEWAIGATSSHGGRVVNFNTRVLGRRGVMEVVLVTGPEDLAVHAPVFRQALAGFAFDADESYAAYVPGDKVAEYGLAALIAGGAAAVAVKSGAGKSFLKLVFGGLAALGAGIVSLFRRRKRVNDGR